MTDYAVWIQHAVDFHEQLRSLPGAVDLEIDVAPPLGEARLEILCSRLRLPLPSPLRRFFTRASAACCCTYCWQAPPEFNKRVKELCQTTSNLYGGACLCRASDCEDFLTGFFDIGECMEKNGFPQERLLWHNSFPLCDEGGGNFLGLFMRPRCSEEEYPVVYLSATPGGYSKILDATFDDFLRHWEELYYLWPNLLLQFCDPTTGRIGPPAEKIDALHQLLTEVLGNR
jgi:hypothetical protein